MIHGDYLRAKRKDAQVEAAYEQSRTDAPPDYLPAYEIGYNTACDLLTDETDPESLIPDNPYPLTAIVAEEYARGFRAAVNAFISQRNIQNQNLIPTNQDA